MEVPVARASETPAPTVDELTDQLRGRSEIEGARLSYRQNCASIADLDAVVAAIRDVVVDRDVLGPVLRVLILMAGTTGLRQSQLLGLRWRDIGWSVQRVRVRNAWVRGEHSGEGKSDLSIRRSVPLSDRLVTELKKWRLRTGGDRAPVSADRSVVSIAAAAPSASGR